MKVSKPKPIRLGSPHCCLCTNEAGGFCHHIGPVQLCASHKRSEPVE